MQCLSLVCVLAVILQIQLSIAFELQVNTTSTESTGTIEWNIVSPEDTHYLLRYHRTGGIFLSNASFDAPYNTSKIICTLDTLYPGVNYTFYISRNVDDASGRIYTGSFNTVPLPPENIDVIGRSSSSLQLTWNTNYNSTQEYHNIMYIDNNSDVANQTPITVTGSAATEFNLTGLLPGHNYSIIVIAVTGDKKSNQSEIFTTVTAPAEPQNFTVRALNTTHLKAIWEQAENSIDDGYSVKFSDPGKEPENTASCDMSPPCIFAPGGTPGQLFTVKVYAHRDSILSIPATTNHNTQPRPVTVWSGSEGERAISFSWESVMHTYFDRYRLEIVDTETTTKEVYNVPKTQTSFTKTDLKGGLLYTIHLYTETLTEKSAPITKLLVALPEPVQNLQGEGLNTTALSASWTLPKNSIIKAIKVMVSKPTGGQHNLTYPKSTQQITVGSLLPGAVYDVTVIVVSNSRESAGITRQFGTKPYPPVIGTVHSDETDVTVTLVLPSEGMFDYLTIQIQGIIDIRNVSKDSPMAKFVGLSEGTEYVVEAHSVSGKQTSDSVVKTFFTKPRPPTNIVVSSSNSTTVEVTWGPPDRGSASNYTVTIIPTDGSGQSATVVTDHTAWTFYDREAGQTYNVTIVTNLGGVDSVPVQRHVTTNPTSVATLSKVEVNTTAIHVNWTRPADSFNFDFFYLTLNPDHGPNPNISRGPCENVTHCWTVENSETSWWFVGLQPGQIYNISINTYKQRVVQKTWIIGVPTFLLVATEPLPVTNLTASPENTDTIIVQWSSQPHSQQNYFIVIYESHGQSKNTDVQFVNGTTQYQKHLQQLLSGYTYTISIIAVRYIQNDKSESDVMVVSATTYPKPVLNLIANTTGTNLTLKWETHGSDSKQDHFQVDYRPVLRNSTSTFLHKNVTQSPVTLLELFPGEMYKVFVYAVSGNMTSSGTSTNATIAPLPPSNVHIIEENTTSSSLTMGWTYDLENTYTQKWLLHYSNDSFQSVGKILEQPGDTEKLKYVFSDLLPGGLYRIDIQSKVKKQVSERIVVNGTVKPVVNTVITENVKLTTNNTIVFSYTVTTTDLFDKFRFSVANNSNIPPVYKLKSDTDHSVSFVGLAGGSVYMIETVTEIRGQISEPQNDLIRTVPNTVPLEFSTTANTVVITFGVLQGHAEKYVVRCDKEGSSCWNQEYSVTTPQAIISNLMPFTEYTIIVLTVSGRKEKTETLKAKTKPAAPSEVRNVKLEETALRTIRVTWELPQYLNGILEYYSLSFSGKDPTTNEIIYDNGTKHIDKTQTMYILEGLKAGYLYTVEVQAFTVAIGEPGQATIQLNAAKPAFKTEYDSEKAKPLRDTSDGSVTESQLKITFVNAFSDFNGRIIAYIVIISTNPALSDTSSVRLPSWKDAQKDSEIVVYQTGNCSDFFLEGSTCGMPGGRGKRAVSQQPTRVFTVGADTDCYEPTYCNGPLKSDTGYYIKLRAYTAAGFSETVFSEKVTTAGTPSSSAGIIGGVIAAVVIAAVAVVVVFVWYRRRRPKRAQKYLGDRRDLEEASMAKMSRPIKLIDYAEHVRKMAADSDFRYAEEYEDLKEVGRDQPTLAAEFPPNRPKNRFTNILPYDHSRVKLLPTDDDEGSDYINANYVPGYISKREYIATQGPLPSTRDDFWRMVWEQNTRNIVMLTKCMEKGREKSDHYWPADSEPKFYGDLQVCILNETHLPDWTISEFKMSLGDTSRQIRHFHYKAWPDFGVPRDPTSLLRFVRTVREKLFRDEGPVVVHCSAGVGRSGTFIVLDHCLQHIKEHDYVDIYGIVYKLRRERVLMVQTEQQYKFIHECILCVLEGREDEATYANVGHVNVGYDDDEGINVEVN